MSKKYIGQVNNQNFVFPNNQLAEYDIDIIHDLKENMVTGSTTGFDINYDNVSGNLYISFSYEWGLNDAEPFIDNEGKLQILSFHLMSPSKKYFKPWVCVGDVNDNDPTKTYKSDTQFFSKWNLLW